MGVIKSLCSVYYFETTAKRGLLIFSPEQETSFDFWVTMISVYNIDPQNTKFYFKKIPSEDIKHYMDIDFRRKTKITTESGGVVQCLIY